MNLRVTGDLKRNFEQKLDSRTLNIGVVGLGYVGLPLAHVFWQADIKTTGFDIDLEKIAILARGESYIKHFGDPRVKQMVDSGRFTATADFSRLADMDAVLICVPTPLTTTRDPDLKYVEMTTQTIAKFLRPGTLVILESTTYPGTTHEVVLPILEAGGLKAGTEFFLAFSPEREDPGSAMQTRDIPKIVGGWDETSGYLAQRVYELGFAHVFKVRDAQTAEAVKITENIFRAVNIALVNELKLVYGRMGIDIWEVIEAAKTKPFGYMAFYPGPGLGGHCIPIDPFYLSWRARAFGMETKFIELAGEINRAMPKIVIQKLAEVLSTRQSRSINGAKILIVGVAYKKDVDDLRESPALLIMEILQSMGAEVAYHDPFIPVIPMMREHATLHGMASLGFSKAVVSGFDAALITTDHSNLDYSNLVMWSKLVVDTRHATKNVKNERAKIVEA